MPSLRVSGVWQHFDINKVCSNFAICRYCGNNISRGGSGKSLKTHNTTNLWSHLRHKHSDKVLVNPVPPRNRSTKAKVSANARNVNVSKNEIVSRPVHMAKPRLDAAQANKFGALPPKWELYERSEETIDESSDDIRDIIYIKPLLCYSPIAGLEDMDDHEERAKLQNADRDAGIRETPLKSTEVIQTK